MQARVISAFSMPQKREVLQLFTRDELAAIVDRFELSAADRRSKDALVDAVASSKKATLAEILPELSRDRLKELCRAFDLDDGGREKSALVDRLTGAKAAEAPPPSKKNGADNGAPAKAIEPVDVTPGVKLTVDRLEGYLWSAADILRGSIDSSDYKNFIFGILFLKRLSDRFEEECEILVKDGDDPEDKDNHQFFVPKKSRWPELQKVATDLGTALNKACSQLEEANHSLEGVLADIDYNDERKLGDARNRDVVLGRLVQHFSKLSLKNTDLSEPDMLGRAYEYLIEKFADDAGKKGGEFYTPRMVVRLIVETLAPKEGMRICDPTAGSGGMLIECAHHLERHKQNPRNLSLFGQEKNLGTWAICKMNMLLHGLPDARIEKGDTIRDPKLREGGELMLFDRVIANPPFSLEEWGREIAEQDAYGRFRFGVPPKGYGDLAFLEHMLATTNQAGMVGIVMPHGVLFRQGAENQIRAGILNEDLIEAVVGLPINLFYGTGIPAAILVLNKAKKAGRKKKVLFIEASREFGAGTNQNFLREQDVKRIAGTLEAFSDVPKYARVVGLEEIEKNDFNLNISRYVETADAAERVDVAHALARLRELEKKRSEAETKMNGYLKELGYDA
jgi:type I restriction enzyme M protein